MTIVALVAIFSLVSCKKDKESQAQTVAQKILGRWNLVSVVSVTTIPGEKGMDRNGVDGEYLDFRNNGKVYSKDYNREEEVSTYKLIRDEEIAIGSGEDQLLYTIKKLTDKDLVLYLSITDEEGSTKGTITLKK